MSNFLFNTIRIKKPKRNKFNLSHDVKLSMRMGELIPIFCQDVVPGDTFKLNTELLIRFAPLAAPVMHRINVYTHFFFVPKRLVWDNWKTFITGGESGDETPAYPRINFNLTGTGDTTEWNAFDKAFSTGTLADYLGFPVDDPLQKDGDARFVKSIARDFDIDALPFRAYQLIWNEYYRDQNLQEEVDIMKDVDGAVTFRSTGNDYERVRALMSLQKRAWTKDYFTSALPFVQRGDQVTLPLDGAGEIVSKYGETDIPVYPVDSVNQSTGKFPLTEVKDVSTGNPPGSGNLNTTASGLLLANGKPAYLGTESKVSIDILGERTEVDLTKVSLATINELRRAVKAQEYLEATARGGSRYIEYIQSIFGVKSSDARLQRPEYLGGGKQPVLISDVMSTAETQNKPIATPAGAAASLGKTHSFKRYFEEFGYVIGIMSVLPVPAYQQGMPKQFMKFDRYDHYIPQFANLGEQEIRTSELYFDPIPKSGEPGVDTNDKLFGYAPRYAEYKFINSSVHGDFRTSLKYWHMGRIFGNRPALNASFIKSDPTERVFAVTSEDDAFDKLWVNIHHNCVALRPMPKYGTPHL